jgi:hypothetical protein
VESAEVMVHQTQSRVSALEEQIKRLDALTLSIRKESLNMTEHFVTEQRSKLNSKLEQFQSKLEKDRFEQHSNY